MRQRLSRREAAKRRRKVVLEERQRNVVRRERRPVEGCLGPVEAMRWYVERAPRVAFTVIASPSRILPVAPPTSHHAHRLDRAEAALDGTPLTAYDVSLALFEDDLSTTLRRFATAEALAHLERLVLEGRAARAGSAYVRAAIP